MHPRALQHFLRVFVVFRSATAYRAPTTMSAWDADRGVWVGDRAAADAVAIPQPLIIFGYGSLCWRPDALLARCESFPCVGKGWTRLFAQRSMDHRGTPAAPGLVVTLVETPALRALPGFDAVAGELADEVVGVAYRVPDDDAERVLAELDFREKGGYSRRVVDVTRVGRDASEGDASGASARCLLYSATVDNPNFWWGDDGRGLDTQRAAEIISSASGPSGPNVDYLRNLGAFLREIGRTDAHVAALESKVDAILAGGGSESSSNSREV